MGTFKLVLRRTLEHRARRLIVITITLAITFGGVGLATDKFFDLRQHEADLKSDLVSAIEESGKLSDLKLEHARTQEKLEARLAQAVQDNNIDEVRDELVMLILDSKCTFRRMEVNDAQNRAWRSGDHPLRQSNDEEDALSGGSGYDLRTQEVSLEVSGALKSIKTLLGRIHSMNRLVHVKSVQLGQEAMTNEIQMQVGLQLFGFKKAEQSEDDGPPPPGGGEAPQPPAADGAGHGGE